MCFVVLRSAAGCVLRKMRWLVLWTMALAASGSAPLPQGNAGSLADGKLALAAKDFVRAKAIYAAYLKAHPGDVQAEMGAGDAALGLHEYEAAEWDYRSAAAAEPQLWLAHRNLVIVEAALGRWEEFERERAVLHAARERGAAGISRHDSDVIDVLRVKGQRWIVRDYFEPAGRAQALYNFERFGADGRVAAFVSLESANAFAEEMRGGDVVIGGAARKTPELSGFALNFYTGAKHGTIATYAAEPKYEQVRMDFLRWLRGR